MKNLIRKLVKYKEKNSGSWIEFIMTFGTGRLEDGAFLVFIYGWGGTLGLLGMWVMAKLMFT